VLTDEVRDAADDLERQLLAELRPRTTVGRFLVRQAAVQMARLDLVRRHDKARRAQRVRHAREEFDDRRLAAPEEDLEKIAEEPATRARRLHQTPEGLGLTVRAWQGLLDDLAVPGRWAYLHWERAENLMGRRPHSVPASRLGALCQAAMGDFRALEANDGAGLDSHERRLWAADQLKGLIEARITELQARLAAFDTEAIARDRAEAGERALFDPSPEAALARKYEAALERSLFRTLKELREVEAAAAEAREPDATPRGPDVTPREPDVTPEKETTSEPLGSFFPGPVPAASEPPLGPSRGPVRAVSGPPELPGTVSGGRFWPSDPPR
jgi:hypothetical protein